MDQEKENKKDIDLSGALKDSDSGVKFQDKRQRPAQTFYPKTLKMIQWVMKYSDGLVKDEKQASYVLIGFVGIFLLMMVILLSIAFGGPPKAPPGESSADFMNRPHR